MRKHVIINPVLLDTHEYKFPELNVTTTYFNFVYLHGKAEKDNGYDCMGVVGPLPEYDGIYPAKVHNNPKPGTLFVWGTSVDGHQHGLFVYNDDENSYKDAEEKYHRKAISI